MADEWGLRTILGPVYTRLLIHGINSVDLEHVFNAVEAARMLTARDLEKNWRNEWEKRANHYIKLAEEASEKSHTLTAQRMYSNATFCYYAMFLINYAEEATKKELYNTYVDLYEKTSLLLDTTMERVAIPLGDTFLPAFLHLPKGEGPFPCTTIITGIGSSKEEMDILARPIVERGVAVCVVDMPGCGEAIYINDIKCRMETLKKSFAAILSYLQNCDTIDSRKIGTAGLCMGGGLAYKAAALNSGFSFCATLFPLVIGNVDMDSIPQWMQNGKWVNQMIGDCPVEQFVSEMVIEDDEKLDVPFLMIHGKYDNWMPLEQAMVYYDRVRADKKLIVVDDEPVFSNKDQVTHAMPVAEQMHWTKELLADWIAEQVF